MHKGGKAASVNCVVKIKEGGKIWCAILPTSFSSRLAITHYTSLTFEPEKKRIVSHDSTTDACKESLPLLCWTLTFHQIPTSSLPNIDGAGEYCYSGLIMPLYNHFHEVSSNAAYTQLHCWSHWGPLLWSHFFHAFWNLIQWSKTSSRKKVS